MTAGSVLGWWPGGVRGPWHGDWLVEEIIAVRVEERGRPGPQVRVGRG